MIQIVINNQFANCRIDINEAATLEEALLAFDGALKCATYAYNGYLKIEEFKDGE